MKNITSRNRSLMQLIGFHDAQHRNSRSKSLEVYKSNSESQAIPIDVKDIPHLATPLDDSNLNADRNTSEGNIPNILH
jgi:hypothetical protein